MIAKVVSGIICGVEPVVINIETYLKRGLPNFSIIGLGDRTVKESKFRIVSALENIGEKIYRGRITVNMSPANIKKKGSYLDLSIAVSVMAAQNHKVARVLSGKGFVGELSLDGEINGIKGCLPIVKVMHDSGCREMVIPAENLAEVKQFAEQFRDVKILPVKNLSEVRGLLLGLLNGDFLVEKYNYYEEKSSREYEEAEYGDFSEIRGQEMAKRAIMIAVAGNHNLLMTGSPGTGKTMLAKCIPGILPPLTLEQKIYTSSIYASAGIIEDGQLVNERPFRNPPFYLSKASLIGGGAYPIPGEVTLASGGVLFLDEMGEMQSSVIEALRQPVEEGKVVHIRKNKRYCFPAAFMLIGAMNPCKCGYYGHPSVPCSCSDFDVKTYRHKLSGAIRDRIDMHIFLYPEDKSVFDEKTSMNSKEMKGIVQRVRDIQLRRFGEAERLNAMMSNGEVEKYCKMTEEAEDFFDRACLKMSLNMRSMYRIRKVARTIADIDGATLIELQHLREAVQYRERTLA